MNREFLVFWSAALSACAIGLALGDVQGLFLGIGLVLLAWIATYCLWSRWAVVPKKKIDLATARRQIQKLESSRRVVRLRAANLLRAVGSDCAPIVPLLVESLSHEDSVVRSHVCGALRAIGAGAREAVPTLVELLKDDPISAAMALGGIGPEASSAIGPLTDELQAGRCNGKTIYASALWKISRRVEMAVPALIDALHDDSAGIRRHAVIELAEIGPLAKSAVPALLLAMRDKDRRVRRLSADALQKIDPPVANGT